MSSQSTKTHEQPTTTSSSPPQGPRTIIEHVADWHAGRTVDRTHRTVRNVALTGVTSKNGYQYAEQALRDAARLYAHKPVFLDHAADKSQPHQRSTRDLVGTIVQPRFAAGRIRGDIRVLDTESGRTFLALCEAEAPGVGMSHVVLAERGVDGTVEQIHDVVSVDAVVFPATTRTFRESTAPHESNETSPDDGIATETVDDASVREPIPGDAGLENRVQQLLCERDALRQQLEDRQHRDAARSFDQRLKQQLDAAGLPRSAITELFVDQLRQAPEAVRTALIAERLELIALARRQPPLSTERFAPRAPARDANATFVATIRRQ